MKQQPQDCRTDPPADESSQTPADAVQKKEDETTHDGEPSPERFRVSPDLPLEVDGHKIIKEIGRGGMGIVYLALEKECNREVAFKVVPPGMSPRQLRRFLEEATVTGQLQHPAIVPIYRIGKAPNGRDYYTMKRVQGRTLSQILAELQAGSPKVEDEFGIRRRASILLSVCDGVAYAHDQGVIHRDLKPANIMVGDYGEVHVLDWGLAKVLFGERQPDALLQAKSDIHYVGGVNTSVGTETSVMQRTVSGTPSYMSPEQARGEIHGVDQRSDVWSLGAILYALLTYHPPIEGKTADEKLVRAAQGKVTPPQQYAEARQAPRELLDIINKALRPDPMERYATARGMAEDLRAYLDGRGRWQLAFHWETSHGELNENEWVQALGTWRVDARGLFASERTRAGAVLLHGSRYLGDVRIEVKGYEMEQSSSAGQLGLMIAAPEPEAGVNETSGYCLRFGGIDRSAKFSRDDVEVMERAGRNMEPGRQHTVAAESVGNRIRMEVDGEEVFSFRDLFPLSGNRVGLFGRSASTRVESIRIYRRGMDAKVSCLSIPDHNFQRGRYAEALAGYVRIAEELGGREEGWLARFKAGLSRLESDDPLGAESEFQRLEKTPGEALAHLGRSLLCAREGDYRRELLRLGAALRVGAGTSMRPFVLALIWTRAEELSSAGQFDAAIPYYKGILDAEKEPGSCRFRALQAITRCQFHLGYDDEALRHLDRMAGEAGPQRREYQEAYHSAVEHFRAKARWKPALTICKNLASRQETAALGHWLAAETEWIQGNTENARDALRSAFEASRGPEGRSRLMVMHARMELDQGHVREAQEGYKEALILSEIGSPLEIVSEHAWLYAMRGKPDRALASLARHLDRGVHEDRMAILAQIGTLSMLRGDLEHARDCLSQAQANLPASSAPELLQECELKLGLVRLATGEVADAHICFQRVTEIPIRGHRSLLGKILLRWPPDEPLPEPPEPGHICPWFRRPEYFYFLGEFARLSGRKDEATRAYRRATIEAPNPHRRFAWLSWIHLAEMGTVPKSTIPDFPPLR